MFGLNLSSEKRELLSELKNVFFIILIMMDFVFILIISFFKVSFDELIFMATFDLFICILLFIQLIYDYYNSDKSFLSFTGEHILDIISMIPFNFIFLRYLAVFRIARMLQFLQLIKLLKIGSDYKNSFKYFIQNRLLKILLVILFIYLLFASVVLTQIDSSFASVFDAFWFNLVSITSVGYGDVTPVTRPGKVLAMFSIILGIMFVSIFTAAMSAVYMEKEEKETRNHIRNQLEKYVENVDERNRMLMSHINDLEKENDLLNEKLDEIMDLLNGRK